MRFACTILVSALVTLADNADAVSIAIDLDAREVGAPDSSGSQLEVALAPGTYHVRPLRDAADGADWTAWTAWDIDSHNCADLFGCAVDSDGDGRTDNRGWLHAYTIGVLDEEGGADVLSAVNAAPGVVFPTPEAAFASAAASATFMIAEAQTVAFWLPTREPLADNDGGVSLLLTPLPPALLSFSLPLIGLAIAYGRRSSARAA